MTRKAVIGLIRAAALAGAMFIAGGAIPVLGGFAMIFSPAPILIYAIGRPRAQLRAILSTLLAGALIFLAAGTGAAIGFAVSFGLATIIAAVMLERRYSFEAIIAVAALAMFSASAVASIIAAGGATNLVKIAHDELAAGVTRSQGFYKMVGADTAVSADIQAMVIDWTMRLSPALALIIAALAMLGNLRLVWRLAGPARLPYRLFGDLLRWSAPEWVVWMLLVTGFAMFVPAGPATAIALNGFICVAAIYFFQGLAIMNFYFHALGVPSVVRVMIYIFLFFLAHLAGIALVSIAGLFDMWIDFRRLKPPREEAGSFGDFL